LLLNVWKYSVRFCCRFVERDETSCVDYLDVQVYTGSWNRWTSPDTSARSPMWQHGVTTTACVHMSACLSIRWMEIHEILYRNFHLASIYILKKWLKITVFWDEKPCSLIERDRCFGITRCFHFRSKTILKRQ
jgi:hypothetical protein